MFCRDYWLIVTSKLIPVSELLSENNMLWYFDESNVFTFSSVFVYDNNTRSILLCMAQYRSSMTILISKRTIAENYISNYYKESFCWYYEVLKYAQAWSNLSKSPKGFIEFGHPDRIYSPHNTRGLIPYSFKSAVILQSDWVL